MKLSDLSLDQLKAKKASMELAMKERQNVASHPKFVKMDFPPHGDAFIKLYNEVCAELEKRG